MRARQEASMATKDTGGGQSKASKTSEQVDEVQVEETTDVAERQAKLTDDVDAILDEIDEVLEVNAEEFIRAYVQKGGQ